MSSSKQSTAAIPTTPSKGSIIRIPPFYYIHVLDQTSNITRLEIGPKTFIRQDNEHVILGPVQMLIIPPNHHCIIQNPVIYDDKKNLVKDSLGQVKLLHADLEVRLEQEPFPLYPGEKLYSDIKPLKVVPNNSALQLRANQDFEDGSNKRVAGDEWLFEGPGIYIPRKEVEVIETVTARIIIPNQALKLRARAEMLDRDGKIKVAGEEWLIKRIGSYLPGAYEEIVDVVSAYVLTDKEAVHVKAIRTFLDEFGITRKNGEEWLVTIDDTDTYIPDVNVTVEGVVQITTLNSRQFCVISNPIGPDGKPQYGQQKLVKGEKSFFLKPGEECVIQDCYLLSEDEGLVLKASKSFKDDIEDPAIERKAGDKWMIRGPIEYIPPTEVTVSSRRQAIPLDENEGVYVRNLKTGKIRAVTGVTYMLNQDEILWSKELPPVVEELLTSLKDPLADRGDQTEFVPTTFRDKTKVITFRVPHNAVVQIYDYKERKARLAFGPDLVLLGPDEQFTQLSLSGGKPKQPNKIRSLCLLLGPDFCTDKIAVETADHARLQLQLAYNWHFEVGDKSAETSAKLFSVPDFVGDLCKAIASRIRGAVAGTSFDDFHKKSATIIRSAVFGFDENKKIRPKFLFPQNNLCITSVDIQSVEPIDQRTRDALQKSVQLAIEITTHSQEATARHEAERREQEAKGKLERQKIADEVEAEKTKKDLLELQASSMAVESCGQAKAEALSRSEAQRIEGESSVEQAKKKVEAMEIESTLELERLKKARESEIKYIKEQNNLEIKKAKEMSELEISKFKDMVSAIGPSTIRAIALAGPELQVKLLRGLGLQSTLITDGKTPVNLFTTAQGFLGTMQKSEN